MERVTDQGATLKKALALTCIILVVELAGGVVSHSLALLSDAGHVLTDVFALGLAWFAVEQSKRPADRRRSYGYQRVSILAALVNSVTLIVIVLAIAFEAVRRMTHPEPVQGVVVIVSALAAIAVNAYVVFGLRRRGKTLNLRAALLHVTGDIGASVGVLVAGVVILLTGWLYIDPLLSLGIAVLIAYGAWRIVRETVNLLLEGTPTNINLGDVTGEITKTERVISAHDLHVWALSSEEMAHSVHVVLEDCPLGDAEHVVRDLEGRLCGRLQSDTPRSRSRVAIHVARSTTAPASTTTRTSTSCLSARRLRRECVLLLQDPPRESDSSRIRRVHASVAEAPSAQRTGLCVRRVGSVEDDAQVEAELRHVHAFAQRIAVWLCDFVTRVEVRARLHLDDGVAALVVHVEVLAVLQERSAHRHRPLVVEGRSVHEVGLDVGGCYAVVEPVGVA